MCVYVCVCVCVWWCLFKNTWLNQEWNIFLKNPLK